MNKLKNVVRKGINLSSDLYGKYVALSESMGLSVNASMVMALKMYMDAQDTLSMSANMKQLLDKISHGTPEDIVDVSADD
jgi:hypothetical protein